MGWARYGRARAQAKALVLFFALLLGSAAVSQAQEEVEILALGDSLTQGYGLVPDDGFVAQLEAWLADNGTPARIINGGVSGDTTAGGLARVEWSLSPSVDAMIVALGGNDLLRGIVPEVSRSNLEGILQVAVARDLDVLLVGMQAPGNYGPDYKADFDAIYPDLATQYGAALAPSFFEGIQSDGAGLAEVAAFMQPDGIHPNADGVRRIVAALGPKVATLIAAAQSD